MAISEVVEGDAVAHAEEFFTRWIPLIIKDHDSMSEIFIRIHNLFELKTNHIERLLAIIVKYELSFLSHQNLGQQYCYLLDKERLDYIITSTNFTPIIEFNIETNLSLIQILQDFPSAPVLVKLEDRLMKKLVTKYEIFGMKRESLLIESYRFRN